jgi:DNA-directed RNA polymerase specialized sigma24 family protein
MLPAKQDIIFTMIAFDGMKQEDVARALKLRQSTVSEHYAKARKLVMAALKKRYPDMEFV